MPPTRLAAFHLLPLAPARPLTCMRCTVSATAAAMPMSATAPRRLRRLAPASAPDLADAGALLRAGKLVAFPTETVYGLGADATNAAAVAAIFTAKGRPSDNPLIVHVSCAADIAAHRLSPALSPVAARLAEAFWPGPLTLVLPLHAEARLAPAVSAGLPSVAVRVPRHPVANALLAAAAVPVAAPSANLSGRPSPTCADHVARDLDGRIDAVVDEDVELAEGNCGLESTVVDLTGTPAVLRPGAISLKQLELATGVKFTPFTDISKSATQMNKPKAPGMKYRHYAPRAPLHLVHGDLSETVTRYSEQGHLVGVLASEEICAQLGSEQVDIPRVTCGRQGDSESFARGLYAALRAFDGEGPHAIRQQVDVILAVPPENVEDGIGEALMNRLNKAAAGRHETVETKV